MKNPEVKLAKALSSAACSLEEVACTCVDRSEGHQRDCVGVSHAKPYFKLAEKFLSKSRPDKVKEERHRIRKALLEELRDIVALTPGEGGRDDVWVHAARNMYHAALRVVRR